MSSGNMIHWVGMIERTQKEKEEYEDRYKEEDTPVVGVWVGGAQIVGIGINGGRGSCEEE